MVTVLIYQVLNNVRDMALIYYSGWVVNGNAYGEYAEIQAKFQMIAMSPMGPGLLVMLPLIKKIGRRKCIWVVAIASIIGAGTAFLNPGNGTMIYAGSALQAIGNLSFVYTFMSFVGDTIDHKELKEYCAKKGLDFDTENQRHLDKVAKKAAKKAETESKKAAAKKPAAKKTATKKTAEKKPAEKKPAAKKATTKKSTKTKE